MSSPGGLSYLFNTAYGVGKAAQDRMAQDFNHELRGTGVHALAIWPGAVKTELIQVCLNRVLCKLSPLHSSTMYLGAYSRWERACK